MDEHQAPRATHTPAEGTRGAATAGPVPRGSTARSYRTVASFPEYAGAQTAVDRLSDDDFPAEHVVIVGQGLRSVEHVTGRRGFLQAAGSGAASGAVLGAFLGALFGLFTFFDLLTSALVLALWGLLLGAVMGALLGLIGHALSWGRRDFSSVRTVEAERYDISIAADHADHADDAERRLAPRI